MRINRLLIAGIVSVGLLTSCASDEESGGGTSSPAVVNLSLATNGATKTNTAFPGGGDTGGTIGSYEGTVKNISVGLFDDKDYKLTLDDYDYSTNGNPRSITTTTRAKKIVVVANVPLLSQFALITTRVGFLGTAPALLEYTTSTDGTSYSDRIKVGSQQPTGLPMFAEDDTQLSSLGTSSSAAPSVPLHRVVARVALTQLATDFSSTPYTGAQFIPKEIFMHKVNDIYSWDGTASGSVSTVTGESTTSILGSIGNGTLGNYAYLSSGILDWSGNATANQLTTENPYFFYVFPHTATTPTKLVVKGVFIPAGKTLETDGEVMYYPIIVNHLQTNTTITDTGGTHNAGDAYSTDSQLATNTCYNIKLTIQGRGVDSPDKDLIPATVSVTLTVAAWATTSQDTTVK